MIEVDIEIFLKYVIMSQGLHKELTCYFHDRKMILVGHFLLLSFGALAAACQLGTWLEHLIEYYFEKKSASDVE